MACVRDRPTCCCPTAEQTLRPEMTVEAPDQHLFQGASMRDPITDIYDLFTSHLSIFILSPVYACPQIQRVYTSLLTVPDQGAWPNPLFSVACCGQLLLLLHYPSRILSTHPHPLHPSSSVLDLSSIPLLLRHLCPECCSDRPRWIPAPGASSPFDRHPPPQTLPFHHQHSIPSIHPHFFSSIRPFALRLPWTLLSLRLPPCLSSSPAHLSPSWPGVTRRLAVFLPDHGAGLAAARRSQTGQGLRTEG